MAISTTSATGSSGLDVNAVVAQLMTVERQPINKLNSKQASYEAKLSAYGQVKSSISSFQTALLGLKSTGSFQAFQATPADSTVLSASASSTAVAGSYALNVTTLAQSQQLVAAGQTSSTAAIGSGAATTLSFDFGTISGGTLAGGTYTGAAFTSNGGGIKTVTIDSTNNTLQGIRDAINAANIGVSATIVNDGSGTPFRLALTSTASGVSNSLSISVAGDAAVSSLLANNPTATQNLSQTVAAQNANFTVNGVAITKTSNTVTDAIQGVTLNLLKPASSTTLTVSKDTAAVTTAATAFVKAYNDLTTILQGISAYNPTTKTGATLQGDSTIRSLYGQLRDILNTPVTGGAFSVLPDVGISTQKDGKLALDSTKFNAAVSSNLAGLANLFSSTNGYVTKLDQWATSTLGNTGAIVTRTDGISKSIKSITDQVAALETRMVNIEARYRKQFTSLDMMLSSMNKTSTFLTQQLNSMNNTKA